MGGVGARLRLCRAEVITFAVHVLLSKSWEGITEHFGVLNHSSGIEYAEESHQAIAQEFQRQYPSLRGLSTRSVRRFCSTNQIHRSSRLSTHEVDSVVEQYVLELVHHMVKELLQVFLDLKE